VLVRRALSASGLTETPDAIPRFLEIYDRRLLNHTHPYEGILDVVRAARGRARVALLTNKPTVPTEKVLAGLRMRDLFDEVIGSDGPYPRKPDPAALRALMATAGTTPASTLMIGDSLVDYETAAAAGTRCCLVSYGFSHHTCEGVATNGASIAADVPSLAAIIDRFVGRA
jgi:phosphoglycolate phosphatase